MRRVLVLGCVAVLLLGIAAPTAAKQGDVEKTKAVYSIPEDVADVADQGQLNHGCSGGEYWFVDGTFTMTTTTSFYPDGAAFNAREDGATMTVKGVNKYSGLWGVDSTPDARPDARFELRDNNIHYEFVFGSDGSELSQSINWSGEFIDTDTGDVVEWWKCNFTAAGDVMSGVAEGSCS